MATSQLVSSALGTRRPIVTAQEDQQTRLKVFDTDNDDHVDAASTAYCAQTFRDSFVVPSYSSLRYLMLMVNDKVIKTIMRMCEIGPALFSDFILDAMVPIMVALELNHLMAHQAVPPQEFKIVHEVMMSIVRMVRPIYIHQGTYAPLSGREKFNDKIYTSESFEKDPQLFFRVRSWAKDTLGY